MTAAAPDIIIEPGEFLTEEHRIDPFPLYKKIRDNDPVYQDKFQNRWFISKYEDIWKIYKNNEDFTRAIYDIKGTYEFGSDSPLGPTILEYGEGEEHRRQRGIVAGEFVGEKLKSWLPIIEETAIEMIDGFSLSAAEGLTSDFIKHGEVDLVAQFSSRFPIRVIAGMLGLPKKDNDYFEQLYSKLFAGMGYGKAYFKSAEQARNELFNYLDPHIEERMAHPKEDLISKFCHAELQGDRMTVMQIKAFIALLLVGGGDTTHKAIDSMWWNLLHNPEQFDAVKKNPELMDRVFTEMLRFDGPNHYQSRRTLREIEVGERLLPMGAKVDLCLGAGNRDERVFTNPNSFNIFREDLYFGKELRVGYWQDGVASHLGFGQERHFCMGYAMARQEAVMASKLLLTALKNPRLKDVPNDGIVFPPPGRGGVRGPLHLEIEFDA